jgi:ATP-dependent DNA helicase RecQ
MATSRVSKRTSAAAHHRPPTRKSSVPLTSDIPWAELRREAKQRFGVTSFRSAQREVLESIFRGKNTLGIMPTGAGKSLTYQLAALFLPHTVVVVSPLIALMQDQQRRASDADIDVQKIDSTLTQAQRREADAAVTAGIPKLLYVTPERLEQREFLEELKQCGVSLFVVDEAHVISQWGHDFRPAYMGLRYARAELGNPPVLALTATATEEVMQDILRDLDATDAKVINAGSERTNLFFAVHPTVNNDAKLARLTQMIADEPGSGIIYTASVRSANDLHERFTEAGISVGHYHGKLTAKERDHALADFMDNKFRVMIATKAFGLGIDKPDIRYVFHFEFPESLETYFQEAGRAGRDGHPSRAVLLFRLEDKRIQSFFSAGRYPRADELRKVLDTLSPHDPMNAADLAKAAEIGGKRAQVLLYLLRDTGLAISKGSGYVSTDALIVDDEQIEGLLAAYAERSEHDRSRLDDMMRYAETVQCRRQVFREYFHEPSGEPCGACDNCVNHTADQHQAVELHAAAEHDGVTRIETITGTIVTTAPETLPKPVQSAFAAGQRVQHKGFGRGTVQDANGDTLLVRFEGAGMKKLKANFVTAA